MDTSSNHDEDDHMPTNPPHADVAPPSPPPPDAQPPSRQLFASRLSTLSHLLDARARNLQVAEDSLAQERTAFLHQQTSFHEDEARARSLLASLLSDIAARQASLTKLEDRFSREKNDLSTRFSSARSLLADAAAVARELPSRRTELAEIERRAADREEAAGKAERDVAALRAERDAIAMETTALLRDKGKLQRASQRLEELEAALRARENDVAAQETRVTERAQQVSQYAVLQRVVAPVQLVLDDLCAADGETNAVDVSTDLPAAVRLLQTKLSEVRHAARETADRSAKLDAEGLELERRRAALRTEESMLHTTLRQREAALKTAERHASATQNAASRALQRADAMQKANDEARAELEARDEALRTREENMLAAGKAVDAREKAVVSLEYTVSRKERSVARAHAAVREREREAERRVQEAEAERARVETLRRELELREGLVHTRDLELSTREARNSARVEPMWRGKGGGGDDDGGTGKEVGDGSAAGRSLGAFEATDVRLVTTAPLAEGTPSGNVQPATVRRHLAFESTTKPPAASDPPGANPSFEPPAATAPAAQPQFAASQSHASTLPSAPPPPPEMRDDESETAAEQLLPELFGARTLWLERITRLEEVVHHMRDTSWAVRPHVQPVLSAIAEELHALRDEVERPPLGAPLVSGSKAAYAREQQSQVRWGGVLRAQLDAVQEVQTGMLIGNKESATATAATTATAAATAGGDDERATAAGGDDERAAPSDVRRASGSGGESVDATLDATGTFDAADVNDITYGLDDLDGLTSSISELRKEMGARRNAGSMVPSPAVITRGYAAFDSAFGARSIAGGSVASVASALPRGERLIQEMTLLRNELNTISDMPGVDV